MSPRRNRWTAIRGLAPVALMAPAAFGVHQLRYILAFGESAGIELQRQGHAYLHSVAPWLVLLVALVAGGFLRALGRAFGGQCSVPRYTLSFAALWLTCSAFLVAMYVLQELLEGLLLTGHPTWLAGIFGYGGWWSIPAALCLGLVLAALFHGGRWVLHEVAQRRLRAAALWGEPSPAAPRLRDVWVPRLAPLAGGWSGRGPPS